MRETEDGFRIAEEDLRLRGEGDVLGTRQSGMPGFRVARIEVHGKLLGAARDDAQLILSRDPTLDHARAARRCATCSICSSATRRSGCSGRVRLLRRRAARRARAALRARARVLGQRGELASAARRCRPAATMPADIISVIGGLDRDVELDDVACAAHRRRSRWSGSACTA